VFANWWYIHAFTFTRQSSEEKRGRVENGGSGLQGKNREEEKKRIGWPKRALNALTWMKRITWMHTCAFMYVLSFMSMPVLGSVSYPIFVVFVV
jgi:hypothetical protein